MDIRGGEGAEDEWSLVKKTPMEFVEERQKIRKRGAFGNQDWATFGPYLRLRWFQTANSMSFGTLGTWQPWLRLTSFKILERLNRALGAHRVCRLSWSTPVWNTTMWPQSFEGLTAHAFQSKRHHRPRLDANFSQGTRKSSPNVGPDKFPHRCWSWSSPTMRCTHGPQIPKYGGNWID